MVRRMKNLCKYIIVFPAILILPFLLGCGTTDPEEKTPAIKILIPKLGDEYYADERVYLVAELDNTQIGSFVVWDYSTDSMATWHAVTLSEVSLRSMPDEEDFSYDVKIWLPQSDSVKNSDVYIKAYDYDIKTLLAIKGPIKITD